MKVRPSLSRLAAIRSKAHRVLWLEALWSELRWPIFFIAIWVGASLYHLPQSLPDSLHALLEGIMIISILWIIQHKIKRLDPITSRAIDQRIEKDSQLPFHPLSTLSDHVASFEKDSNNNHHQLIWAQHQSRALTATQKLRVSFPRFFPNKRIKLVALLVFLTLGATLYASGPHTLSRLRAGFLPGTDDDYTPLPSFQAWIDSPAYAPAAPLFLTHTLQNAPTPFAEGATIHIIISDSISPPILRGVAIQHIKRLSARSWQLDASLHRSRKLSLHVRGRVLARWKVDITPDRAPRLSWTGIPKADPTTGQTRFPWKAEQDHGLASLEIILSAAPQKKQTLQYHILRLPLSLKGTPTHAENKTLLDLSDDPLAGMKVQAQLHGRSVSGLESKSSPIIFTLGARSFSDPLARALIFLRQHIALKLESISEAQKDLSLLTQLNLPGDLQLPLVAINASFQNNIPLSALQEKLWFLARYAEDRQQSGLVMAASMAELRAAQYDVQHQINLMGETHPPSLEQQRILRQCLDRVEEALNHHMKLMVLKANQNGIVMPLPNGEKAPWTKLAQNIEKDTQHNATHQASEHLRQMVEMADHIRQASISDMQSLAQQMAAQAEARAQRAALRDLVKRETELLNHTQARLAVVHRKMLSMQNNSDISQMSTTDLLKQLGLSPSPHAAPPSQSEVQLDDETQQYQSETRQNNHAVQYALRILDHILLHRGKDLTHKDNQGLTDAEKDMKSVLQALAQRHDAEAAVAERKVLEDLTQARKEMTKNQKSSQKNQQGKLGFIPPPQSNPSQNQDPNNNHHSPNDNAQGMGSMDQDPDQDLDDNSDDSQEEQNKNENSSQNNQDPLGRKIPNGPGTDAHIPEHDHSRARAIERELQRRASDHTRPQSELDYLNRLLAPFRKTP